MNVKDKKKELIQNFYRENRFSFGVAAAGSILTSLGNIYLAVLIQEITDVTMGGKIEDVWALIVKSICFLGLLFVIQQIVRVAKNNFTTKAIVQYREAVFANVLEKDISAFTNENTGNYISALTNDIVSIEKNFLLGTFDIITYGIYFVATLVCMFFYNVSMSLVVIVSCFVPVLASIFGGRKLSEQEKDLSEKNAVFVNMVQDMLGGFTVVKSFNAEKYFLKKYQDNNRLLGKTRYDKNMTEAQMQIWAGILSGAVQLGIFLYGAYLAVQGKMTAGTVIAFVQLMNYILSPIQMLPQLWTLRKSSEELINKMVQSSIEHVVSNGEITYSTFKKDLCLENISFCYDATPVLKEINVSFDSGKSYAIVGASGSGKTTLLNLLYGGLRDYSGRITIDGIDVREIRRSCIYDIFSLIEQNIYVFDDTIQNNIRLYQSVEEEELKKVIEKASLTNLIESKGRNYACGENGCKLSGGEKQRISIARSLLRRAGVMLLDEATSALDGQNARDIINEILKIEEVTKIIVTHKLDASLLKRFDEIIVLRNGRIEEKGSFHKLIENKGYFYALYNIESGM